MTNDTEAALIRKDEALAVCQAAMDGWKAMGQPHPALGAKDCRDAIRALPVIPHVSETPESEHEAGAVLRPRCRECGGTGQRDTGGTYPWGEGIFMACDCPAGSPAPAQDVVSAPIHSVGPAFSITSKTGGVDFEILPVSSKPPIITFHADGSVDFDPTLHPTEAAKEAWAALLEIKNATKPRVLRSEDSIPVARVEHVAFVETNAPATADVIDRAAVDVQMVEMVDWSAGYEQPADPIWRIEIDGYCADFHSEQGAKNFASAIRALPAAPAQEAESLRAERDKWFESAGAHHVASMREAQRADQNAARAERAEAERDAALARVAELEAAQAMVWEPIEYWRAGDCGDNIRQEADGSWSRKRIANPPAAQEGKP